MAGKEPKEPRTRGRFSEALRYLSRFYSRDRRNSKPKESQSGSSLNQVPSVVVPTNLFYPVTTITPRKEDIAVADNLIRRASNQQTVREIRPDNVILHSVREVSPEREQAVTPVKKISTPSKSPFDNLHVEKSGSRARGSPVRVSHISECSEGQMSTDNSRNVSEASKENLINSPTSRIQSGDTGARSNLEPNPDLTARQSSNQTLLSDKSCVTVQRDPSKRCRSPIATIDSRLQVDENGPFSDKNAIRLSSGNSDAVNIPAQKGQIFPVGNGHGSSSNNGPCISLDGPSRSSDIPETFRISSRSSDMSRRMFSGCCTARREVLRSRALIRFNISCEALGIEIAPPPQVVSTNSEEQDQKPEHPSTFLGRIRSVKSNLGEKHKNSAKRTLRRIKTIANLNIQYPLDSLKGKGLEDLARLGGLSYFSLPSKYSPAPLKLPTCFTSSMLYLLRYGTCVKDIYKSFGHESVVSSVYSHYAEQVLSAEISKDTIDKTTRAIEPPIESVRPNHSSLRGTDFVHDVATVFRRLLYGIPGGILGSKHLYEVLKQIHDHNFTLASTNKDPGRGDYVSTLPSVSAARVRLITLAIIAMTSDMQLELICAVFGLLSLTADECTTERRLHQEQRHPDVPCCNRCDTLPNSDFLGEAFGALLADPKSIGETRVINGIVEREHDVGDVASMLIDHWKDVCVQLQAMDAFSLVE
ncbi:hypothetical protein FQN55_008408 [Onygenales sp. PD_40]|nr:hypothetical protein FQN55_008408 [Onygenales sp. PD_40]KAK2773732.1 hypothetical protein FQN53_003969 [Emmonsiellopsis sp. PD_33]